MTIRRRTALALRTLSLATALLHAPTLAAWQKLAPARCNLGKPTSVLVREGDQRAADGRLLVRWDVKTSTIWDGTAQPSEGAYQSFRDELARRLVTTDPRRVLRRSPTTNNLLVLAHARIWIKPATCLEKSLYGLQHDRISTFDEPTEFSAFVLSSPDNKTQRIYWYSVNRNGIGNASPLTDPVRGDVMAGWRVRYVLHSHPFKPSDDYSTELSHPASQMRIFK